MRDTSGLVAIILAALVFVGCGVWWYFSYDAVMNEQTGLKVQLKTALDNRKVAVERSDKMKKNAAELSALVGMNSETTAPTSLTAMVDHLNVWAKRLGATECRTKYAGWRIESDGQPVIAPPENDPTARDLCWLKDSRSPAETRPASETPDVKQYLLAELEALTAQYVGEAANLEGEAARAITAHNEQVGDGRTRGRLGSIIDEKERRVKELRDAIRNIEQQIVANTRASEQAIADLEKEVRMKLDELDAIKDKHEAQVLARKRRIQELTERVFAIETRRQTQRESTEADGIVINSIPDELTAWVDIGRKDALLKGTIFEVFTMHKGGRKVSKGKAVVIQVHSDYSVVSLLREAVVSLADGSVLEGKTVRKGPVVEVTERNGNKVMVPVDRVRRLDWLDAGVRIERGDYVANEVFNRKTAKTFVFAGKLAGRYTNEQMAKLVEEYGGKVDGEVGSETTYLVVGADFEKDPNFAKAESLGVKIIRETDLYELLGIQK